MAVIDNQLRREIEAAGFTLVRSKRHLVWRHRNGGTLVTSASASDWRHIHKIRSNIRRITSKG